MIKYDEYKFSITEYLINAVQWSILSGAVGMLFFDSFIAVLLLFAFVPFFLIDKKKLAIKKRREDLNVQFKDAINSISAALGAGYSIENSFREAYKELLLIYGSQDLIIMELNYIIKHMEMNETIESLLIDFADRSKDEDIKSFAEVFVTAKRMGGDFISIISMTSKNISEKIDVRREISVILSSRQLEQKIMNVIPLFIIVYIRNSSPGFFEPLYGNIFGIIVMSVCLILYILSYLIGRKIVNVEV